MEFLKKLCETYAPCGNEEKVNKLISNEIKSYVDEVKIDSLNNLICKKGTGKKKIMLACRTDSDTILITHVEKSGFARFSPVGKVDLKNIISQEVIFDDGTIGIVCSDTDDEKLDYKNLYIDTFGKKVNIGDYAVVNGKFVTTNNYVISRAIGTKSACYILVEIAKRLNVSTNTVYFAFTSNGQVGYRGAKVAVQSVAPDLAISIGASSVGNEVSETSNIKCSNGAVLLLKDKLCVADSSVCDRALKGTDLKLQREVSDYGMYHPGRMFLADYEGDSIAINIPTKHLGTSNEAVLIDDIEATINTLLRIITKDE